MPMVFAPKEQVYILQAIPNSIIFALVGTSLISHPLQCHACCWGMEISPFACSWLANWISHHFILWPHTWALFPQLFKTLTVPWFHNHRFAFIDHPLEKYYNSTKGPVWHGMLNGRSSSSLVEPKVWSKLHILYGTCECITRLGAFGFLFSLCTCIIIKKDLINSTSQDVAG